MCLNILNILSILDSLSSASLDENKKKTIDETGGDTKEESPQDDGKNAVTTTVTEVVWTAMVSLAMWALSVMTWTTVVLHIWVRTAMWATMDTNSLGVTTVASSLPSLNMLHHLGPDESDSEAERLDTVVCELLGLASSGVASDFVAWESTKDADGVLMDAIDMVDDLEWLQVYSLAGDGLDGDEGVVDADGLIDGGCDSTKVDVKLNGDSVNLSFLWVRSMADLRDEGSVADFVAASVDNDIVKRETVAVGLDGEDQVAEFTFSIPRTSLANESDLLLVVIPDGGLGVVDGIDNEESRGEGCE